MKMCELITVVVPIYKVEKYLESCLDSILAQSYQNLEILLVPQPGGDLCEEICRKYEKQDGRIHVIPQSFCDLSHARNIGIENAKGRFIAFIDSDDMIDPDFIRNLYQLLVERKADIAQCSSYAFLEESAICQKIDKPFIHEHSGKDMCYGLMANRYGTDAGVIQTKLYKTSLFHNIRFPEGRLNEDGAVNYKLYWKSGKIVVTGQKLYYYRSQRPGSIIHTVSDRLCRDTLISARECCEFYQGKDDYLYASARYCLCNNIIRARYQMKHQKEYVDGLKQEQRKSMKVVMHAKAIRLDKKILTELGYLSPGLWMQIWKARDKARKFYEWRIKGAKK